MLFRSGHNRVKPRGPGGELKERKRMIDQICARCGGLLTMTGPEPYCSACNPAAATTTGPTPRDSSGSFSAFDPIEDAPTQFETSDDAQYGDAANAPPLARPDPDWPAWGVPSAFGVWLFSFAAIFVIPLLVVGVMLAIRSASGEPLPTAREEMEQLLTSPSYLLAQVAATYPAHLLTIAVCWAVVTGFRKRPFLESLGWQWDLPLAAKAVLIPAVCVCVLALSVILEKILPNKHNTSFEQMVSSSVQVRYAVAALAVFTAPLVEEFVYRGVLYSALRKRFGIGAAVTIVTLLFTGVHVPQYYGAWAGIASLLVLSLILTMFRAVTRSVKPCVAIHILFNAVEALFLVSNAGK